MLLQDNEEIPDEVMVRAKKEKEKKRRLSSRRRSSRKSETSRLGRADVVFIQTKKYKNCKTSTVTVEQTK